MSKSKNKSKLNMVFAFPNGKIEHHVVELYFTKALNTVQINLN